MSGFEATVFAGRYRVIRRLGAGGTAAVYLAHDERLGRDVALKRLHGAEVTAETAARLRREARIMASLRHPNLVTVFDMLMDEEDLLLAMEYVRGETLADVLTEAPLEWDRVRALLEPVAAALDHVHAEGVVHRDLKPSNVLVDPEGRIKVADLGLATAAEITKITPPGAVLGTPAYMAPEQSRAGPCTGAVDIFAFATIVFQALSATLPRAGRSVVSVLAQATREPVPDLRERLPGAPAAAAEALKRGMSADPERRQRTASQLLEEVDAAFRTPSAPRPAPAAPRRPPRNVRARVLALAALLVAVAAVAIVIAATRDGGSASPSPSPSPRSPARTASGGEPTPTATRAAPRPLSSTETVRAFYTRAAAGRYDSAWRLAGPGMRAAFGNSLERFRREMSSLRRIEFRRLAVTARDDASVTVEIRSVATHDDRVDRCSGTLRAVRGDGGRWVVEPAGLQCTSG